MDIHNNEHALMQEYPHDYLPDQNKDNKTGLDKMDMNSIYKSVKSFNESNKDARKKWPGNGTRKNDVHYRHFRDGKHEVMI